jgi:N-acetylneuraminic acid mutarotase
MGIYKTGGGALMKKYIIVGIALIYIFLSVNMLFAAANTWTKMTDFTGNARKAAIGFSIGSKGYIGTGTGLNGFLPLNDFWEYDPTADTWTQKTDFTGTAREAAIGFSIGSKGYIGTGWDGSLEYNDFWEYDPTANTWTKMANFGGAARYAAVGFSIGSKGYIGTGWDGSLEYNDFWEYDPTTNTWTKKADFTGNARDSAVGFSIGSKGYIGTGYDGSLEYNDFWEYDPTANTWTKMADFGGATGIARDCAIGFSIGSKGYIGMGLDITLTLLNDFWEYEPTDTTPDQFTFTDQPGVALSTTITSNTITVSGINVAAPISITGGTYSINPGSYTSASGTVNNGNNITVQLTSSGSYSTKTSATLTIGGVSATFNVTTQAAPASASGGKGGGCFIATAAFGSPMAGQVEILRQFRDRYLLTNDFGRKFVAWYYRNSPVAASYIKDKPLVKAAVRVALYPLIGFSLLLISGYLPLVTVGLLLSALLFLRFRPKKLSAT